jgi:hypothetical protein
MSAITLESLNEKLKYAPSSILEKIWGYADALLENNELTFKLSEEQKKHLLKQNDVPLDQCIDAEEVYRQLKKKYEL